LWFACNNIYLIFFTGIEFIKFVEITSININGEFWFPCLKIVIEVPDVNIDVRFACNNSNISNLACCEIGFEVLGNNEGGAVRKRSSDEENVKLHCKISKDRP